MGWGKCEYVAPPCPMCGKEDAARMGSTSWGHDTACCSNECGMAYRDSVQRYENDLELAKLELMSAQQRVRYAELSLQRAKEVDGG